MKIWGLILVLVFGFSIQGKAQSVITFGIQGGPQRTYSHLIDYRSSPNKISGAWNHYEGISLSYQNSRFPISFRTGIGISHLSNNFTFKSFPRYPVFSRDADIPTEKIPYKVIEVPVNLHYQIFNSGKFRLNTLLGMSYLTEAFAYIPTDNLHYSTHIEDKRTDWTVDWYYYLIHAKQ